MAPAAGLGAGVRTHPGVGTAGVSPAKCPDSLCPLTLANSIGPGHQQLGDSADAKANIRRDIPSGIVTSWQAASVCIPPRVGLLVWWVD